MIDPTLPRPAVRPTKAELLAQVHEYHDALRAAHAELRAVRTRCRNRNHPLSIEPLVVCYSCDEITRLLGGA